MHAPVCEGHHNARERGIHVPECDRYDPYFVVYDFEALYVPIEEELQGRTLHFKHVPATVSICSNVPGHTNPVHIRSHGEPQQLVDEFVQELMRIQAARERYQPIIDALNLNPLTTNVPLMEHPRNLCLVEKCLGSLFYGVFYIIMLY